MKNNSTFQKYIAPIVVLVGICLVVSAALAATYGITTPIIEARAKAEADAARQVILPAADSFTAYTGDLWHSEDNKVKVTEAYIADNGSGAVITVETSSFGGALTEMVGIDASGAITGVQISSHADTPGVGTNAMTDEHLGQYIGLSSLSSTDAKSDEAVDHVSGASVSSNAIHYGIYAALQQFSKMGGVQ
ncbi:MAG: FMN-binding protein [Firmicutes bacterium]|nr:FMN-binding protein [Bacillota bacterium]